MLNKLHITVSGLKIWFNSQDSDARVHKTGNFFAIQEENEKKFKISTKNFLHGGLVHRSLDI
jgi:hypothetical protein